MSQLPPGFGPPDEQHPPGSALPPPSYPQPGPAAPLPPPGFAPPPGYQDPRWGAPVGPPKTNSKAVASLAVSIGGFFLGILCGCAMPVGAIVAIVLGRMARGEIRSSGGAETGNGIAIAGEVIGWVEILLLILAIFVIVALIMLGNQVHNVFSNISTGLDATPSPG